MTYCIDFFRKFKKDGNFCGLDKSQVSRLTAYLEIVELLMKQKIPEEQIYENLSVRAAEPLITAKDAARTEGLNYVTSRLKEGKKIKTGDIQTNLQSCTCATPPTERKGKSCTCATKKPLTQPEPDHPNHGQFVDQPGTLPVTDAPPQPSLAEQIKTEEPAPVEPAKKVPACLIGPAPVVPMPVPTEKTAKEIYMDACNAAYEHGKPDFRLAIDELMRYHPSWKDAGTVIYFCVTDPKEAIVKKK